MEIVSIGPVAVTMRLDPVDCRLLARVCREAGTFMAWEDQPIMAAATEGLACMFLAAGHATIALSALKADSVGMEDADFDAYAGDEWAAWPTARRDTMPAT